MSMLCISGIGTATTQYSIAQSDAADVISRLVYDREEHSAALNALFRRCGVKHRGSVILEKPNGSGPRQTFYRTPQTPVDRGPTTAERVQRYAREAPDLAVDAAQQALLDADVPADRVTHLIIVTCTGFVGPGVDIAMIKRLGLSPEVGRIQVGFMGCHGAINGLRAAQGIGESESEACILLCAVELCSLHYYYGWDKQKVVSNALFADGAAALVIRNSTAKLPEQWSLRRTGSMLMPDSEDCMGWQIGDNGFEMSLSPHVPRLIGEHLKPWLARWLGQSGLTLDDIRSWAVHPGGPRILQATAEALQLVPEDTAVSTQVLAECGNMSSPTVLFVLQRLQQQEAKLPCVALAFGPGLAAEVALFV
jgi:alkylresorcinol/alkylpyrone synthase